MSTPLTPEIERELFRLIVAEKFDECGRRIRETLTDPEDADQVRQMLEFASSAIIEVRARRTHLQSQHDSLADIRRYLGPGAATSGDVDLVG